MQNIDFFLTRFFSNYDSLHFGNRGKAQFHKYEWNLAETKSHLGLYCMVDYTDKENNTWTGTIKTESKYASINLVL